MSERENEVWGKFWLTRENFDQQLKKKGAGGKNQN